MTSRTFGVKELELLYGSVEHVAYLFYVRGHEDAKAGKSLKEEEFVLSKATKLQIKTNLNKALNSR